MKRILNTQAFDNFTSNQKLVVFSLETICKTGMYTGKMQHVFSAVLVVVKNKKNGSLNAQSWHIEHVPLEFQTEFLRKKNALEIE